MLQSNLTLSEHLGRQAIVSNNKTHTATDNHTEPTVGSEEDEEHSFQSFGIDGSFEEHHDNAQEEDIASQASSLSQSVLPSSSAACASSDDDVSNTSRGSATRVSMHNSGSNSQLPVLMPAQSPYKNLGGKHASPRLTRAQQNLRRTHSLEKDEERDGLPPMTWHNGLEQDLTANHNNIFSARRVVNGKHLATASFLDDDCSFRPTAEGSMFRHPGEPYNHEMDPLEAISVVNLNESYTRQASSVRRTSSNNKPKEEAQEMALLFRLGQLSLDSFFSSRELKEEPKEDQANNKDDLNEAHYDDLPVHWTRQAGNDPVAKGKRGHQSLRHSPNHQQGRLETIHEVIAESTFGQTVDFLQDQTAAWTTEVGDATSQMAQSSLFVRNLDHVAHAAHESILFGKKEEEGTTRQPTSIFWNNIDHVATGVAEAAQQSTFVQNLSKWMWQQDSPPT